MMSSSSEDECVPYLVHHKYSFRVGGAMFVLSLESLGAAKGHTTAVQKDSIQKMEVLWDDIMKGVSKATGGDVQGGNEEGKEKKEQEEGAKKRKKKAAAEPVEAEDKNGCPIVRDFLWRLDGESFNVDGRRSDVDGDRSLVNV
jgi:hypothetical protein